MMKNNRRDAEQNHISRTAVRKSLTLNSTMKKASMNASQPNSEEDGNADDGDNRDHDVNQQNSREFLEPNMSPLDEEASYIHLTPIIDMSKQQNITGVTS